MKTAKPDTNLLNNLNLLGHQYLVYTSKETPAKLDSALFFFNKELEVSKQLHIDEGNGRLGSLCGVGEVYLLKNEFEQGKAYFMQVYDTYRKAGNKKEQGKTLLKFGRNAALAFWPQHRSDLVPQIISCYEEAVTLFIGIGDVPDEIVAYLDMIDTHNFFEQVNLAVADCMRAINKYRGRYDRNLTWVYFRLSIIERYKGNYQKSLQYTLECIRILEKSHDKSFIADAAPWFYGELGLIYDGLGQTENSILWYKKALAMREDMPIDLEFKYRTAGFIVQGLIREKKYREAFSTALGIEKRHPPSNDYNKAIISQIKANCYDAVGNTKKAEELYLLALRLFGDVRNDEIVLLAKDDLAKFYIKQQNYQKAAICLNETPDKGMPVTMFRDWHLIYYKIDSARGNYISALQHHIQYKRFNDSIFNTDKNRQLQQLEVQFQTEGKEQDILNLKKESAFQRDKAQQANNIRNLTLVGGVLLIILLVVIYSNYRAKQRSNVALNALVNEKDNLLKEKEWLIKEIHHRVKNNLQIVMGLLQRQSAYIDNEAALHAIQNSESRMHSIALIHQKLYQSEGLDLINMAEYINELVSYLKESTDTGARISFDKDIDAIDLGVSQAVPLGLILNEALTNAIKYAYPGDQCGIITIKLKRSGDGRLLLTIEDHGQGMPDGFSVAQSHSLGMNLMKGLSKQIDGIFEMDHHDGVTIRIAFRVERLIRHEHVDTTTE